MQQIVFAANSATLVHKGQGCGSNDRGSPVPLGDIAWPENVAVGLSWAMFS